MGTKDQICNVFNSSNSFYCISDIYCCNAVSLGDPTSKLFGYTDHYSGRAYRVPYLFLSYVESELLQTASPRSAKLNQACQLPSLLPSIVNLSKVVFKGVNVLSFFKLVNTQTTLRKYSALTGRVASRQVVNQFFKKIIQMNFITRVFLLIVVLMAFCGVSHAQHVAVKSNLLYDATTTLNIGAEVKVAPRWTIEGSFNYNPWTFGESTKIRQLTFQPEARYWFCQSFTGHFLGLDAIGGIFNIGHIQALKLNKINRYEGWAAGLGLSYGYDWLLSPRWNLEASIAGGYVRADYQTYRCVNCGRKIGGRRHTNYVGPTKASISIVYLIK